MPVRRMKYSEFKSEELDRSAQFSAGSNGHQPTNRYSQSYAAKTVLPPLNDIAANRSDNSWGPSRSQPRQTPDADTASVDSWVTENESPRPAGSSPDSTTSRSTLVPSASTQRSEEVERSLSPYTSPGADPDARPTTASSARYSSAAEEHSAEVARFVNVKKDGRSPTPVPPITDDTSSGLQDSPRSKAPGHLYSDEEVNRPVSPESVITSASFERGDDGALRGGDHVSIDYSEEGGETPTPAKTEQARPLGAHQSGGPTISLTPASAIDASVERNVSLLTKHTKSSSSSNSTGQRLREVPSISSIGQSRSPSPQSESPKVAPSPPKAAPVSPLRPGFGPRGASPNDPTSGRPMSFVALPRGPEGAPLQERIDIAKDHSESRPMDHRQSIQSDGPRSEQRQPQLSNGNNGQLPSGGGIALAPALRAPSAPFASVQDTNAGVTTITNGREASRSVSPAPRFPPARNSMDSPAQGPPRAHKRLSLTPSALRNEMPITPPERSPMAPLQKPVLIAPVTSEPEPTRKKKRESAFKLLDVFKHRSSNSESGLPIFGRTTPEPDTDREDRSVRRQSIEIRGPPQAPRQPRPMSVQGGVESTAGSARQSLDMRGPVQTGPASRQTSAQIQPEIVRKPLDTGARPVAARFPSNPPLETKPAHQRQTAEIRGLQVSSVRSTVNATTNDPMRPYKSMRDYSSDTKAVISTFGAPNNVSRASTPVSRYDYSPSEVPSPVASISRYEARSSSPTMVRNPVPRLIPEEARTEPPRIQPAGLSDVAQTAPEQYRQTRVIQGPTPIFAENNIMQPAPLTIVKDPPQNQSSAGLVRVDPPRSHDTPRQPQQPPAANPPPRVYPQQQVRPLEPKQVTEHVKRAAALAPEEPSSLQKTSLSALHDMVAGRPTPPATAQVSPTSSRPINAGQPTGSVPLPVAATGSPSQGVRLTAHQSPQEPQSKRTSMLAPRNVIADAPATARPSQSAAQEGMLRPTGPPADAQFINSVSASSQRESTTTETTPEKTRKKRFSALGGLLTKANAAVSDLKHMIKDDKATQGLSYDRTQPDRPPSSIRIHAVPPNPDPADWDARNRLRSSSPVPPINGQSATRQATAASIQSPPIPQSQWTGKDAHGNPSSQVPMNAQATKPTPLPQLVTAAAKSKIDGVSRDAPISAVRPPPTLERFSTQSSVDSATQLSPMVSAEQRRRSSSNSENTVVSPVSIRRDSSPERPQNRRASRSGHTGGIMPSVREQHQEQPYQISAPQVSQVEADVEQREIWEAAQARGRWLRKDASEHGMGESPPVLPNVTPISPLVMPARPVATPRISSQSLVPTSRQPASDSTSVRALSPPSNMQQSTFTRSQDGIQGPVSQLPPANNQPSVTIPTTRQAPIVTPQTPTSNQSQMPPPVINLSPPTTKGPINPALTVQLPSEAALQMVQRKFPPPASPEKQMEQHRIQHLAEYRTQEESATAGADAANSGLSPVQRSPISIAQPQPRRASREMQILADVPEVTAQNQEENKEMGVSAAADAHSAALDKVRQARALVQARRQSEVPAGAVDSFTLASSNETAEPVRNATISTATSLHTTLSMIKTPIDKLGITASPPPAPPISTTHQSPTSPRLQTAAVHQHSFSTQNAPSSPPRSAPNTTLSSPILPEVVRFNSLSTDPRRIPKELHRSPSRDAPELRTQLTQEEEDWLYAQRLQRDEEKNGEGLERVEDVVEPVVMKATSGPMDDWSLW